MVVVTRDPDNTRPRSRRAALVGLFFAVAVVHMVSPGVQVTDSRLSVPTAYAVVRDGTLALDGVPSVAPAIETVRYDVVRRDGRTLPFFPWPPMMLAIPGVAAADVVGIDVGSMRPSDPNETYPIEVPTAALLVAASAVVVALVVRDVASDHPRAGAFSIGVALLFAFGTAAWSTGSRSLWAHTPAMLSASVALLAAVRSRDRSGYLWLLGAALATGFVMRPTGAVPLLVLGSWSLVAHRRGSWRVMAAGAAVAVPFVAVNLATYGSILAPYYAGTRIGSEAGIRFGESLLVHLISPNRGLLAFTPIFVLAPVGLWLRKRSGDLAPLDVAVGVTCLLHWIVIAGYGSTGGSSYGARFFTEIVPYLLYLCVPVLDRVFLRRDARRGTTVAVATLAFASVALTIPGALTRSAFCWSATPEFVDSAPERVWDWSDPQFFRPISRLMSGASARNVVIGSCEVA